jgi:hypothetical protein
LFLPKKIVQSTKFTFIQSQFLENAFIVPTIPSFITRLDKDKTNNCLLNYVGGLIYKINKFSLEGLIFGTGGSTCRVSPVDALWYHGRKDYQTKMH